RDLPVDGGRRRPSADRRGEPRAGREDGRDAARQAGSPGGDDRGGRSAADSPDRGPRDARRPCRGRPMTADGMPIAARPRLIDPATPAYRWWVLTVTSIG